MVLFLASMITDNHLTLMADTNKITDGGNQHLAVTRFLG